MKQHNEPTASGPRGPRYPIAIPPDFPSFEGDRDIAIVDTLICDLLRERACLCDPTWGPFARARIEEARRALIAFGDAPYSIEARYELIVWALDEGARIEAPVESGKKHAVLQAVVLQHRAAFVQLVIGEAMPDAQIPSDVLLDVVKLWPETKRRQAREDAVRALARVLDCDAKSLMVMLRQARSRLRDQGEGTT